MTALSSLQIIQLDSKLVPKPFYNKQNTGYPNLEALVFESLYTEREVSVSLPNWYWSKYKKKTIPLQNLYIGFCLRLTQIAIKVTECYFKLSHEISR
jgi:hypothetical protein